MGDPFNNELDNGLIKEEEDDGCQGPQTWKGMKCCGHFMMSVVETGVGMKGLWHLETTVPRLWPQAPNQSSDTLSKYFLRQTREDRIASESPAGLDLMTSEGAETRESVSLSQSLSLHSLSSS